MGFQGLWKIADTDETLMINGPLGSDQYTFEYSINGQSDERLSIFLSNDKQALLANSKVYGRSNITIIDGDSFFIGDQRFTRIIEDN